MVTRALPVLIAIALAGCSRSASTAVTKSSDMFGGAGKVDQMRAWDRRGILFRAVRDAGWPCDWITEEIAMGRNHGNPIWRVRCEGSRYYLVEVAKGGTVVLVSWTKG